VVILFYDGEVEIHAPAAGRGLFGAQVFFQTLVTAVFVGAVFHPHDQLLPAFRDACVRCNEGIIQAQNCEQTAAEILDAHIAFRINFWSNGDPEFVTIVRAAGQRVGVVEAEDAVVFQVIQVAARFAQASSFLKACSSGVVPKP
jgi:hypothetical protein